jgi:hypothetical protein
VKLRRLAALVVLTIWAAGLAPLPVSGQVLFTDRGFVEARGFFFPSDAPNDSTNLVGDLWAREELFVKPAPWLQFAAGVDLRANTHDQVERLHTVDFSDRGAVRPPIATRRLTLTLAKGPVTLDLGKQFIRWGKTDIVTPTDRFAPRDFVDVIDSDVIPVIGARTTIQVRSNTLDLVWLPRFTPSRTPLLDERWTVVPPSSVPVVLRDGGGSIPTGSQTGVRWSHVGGGYEYSASFYDGFNNLPNTDAQPVAPAAIGSPLTVVVTKHYPTLRSYGADLALPTKWFTVKGEAAYFTTSTSGTDEYVIWVLQLERQAGEWLFIGGYAGDVTTKGGTATTFAPDRGTARSIVARASYTIDPNRSASIESAIRQNGRGLYVKGEYSEAYRDHWRATATAAVLAGHSDDFLGQYRRDSHVSVALRYSF